MKIEEIRQKPKEELELFLRESKEKLRKLKFDLSAGKVKNIRQIREIKKDIARALTLLNQNNSTKT